MLWHSYKRTATEGAGKWLSLTGMAPTASGRNHLHETLGHLQYLMHRSLIPMPQWAYEHFRSTLQLFFSEIQSFS